MKNRRNYYRILHVQPDAPAAIIKASYRTLMQKLKAHPDLGGDDWNAALINEAFAVIMDPAKRADYDDELRFQARRRGTPPPTQPETQQPPPPKKKACGNPPRQSCPFCRLPQLSVVHHGPEDTCSACASPLRAPRRVELESTCKRAAGRIAREGALRIFTHWPQDRPHSGLLIDLSPNGSRIGSPLALPAGAVIKLEGEMLSAVARVVSCLASATDPRAAFHLGTEFLTIAFTQTRGTFLSARI